MKNNTFFFSSLIPFTCIATVCLMAVSCVGPVYTDMVPLERQKQNLLYNSNSPNMPVNTKKGDGLFIMTGSFGNNAATHNGVELQSSYAPGKHIAVLLNSFIAGRKTDDGKHNNTAYVDAGMGYFQNLGGSLTMEIYGGFGTGSNKNEHYTGYSKSNVHKFYLQPSIGYTAKDRKFKAAAGIRFSQNKFTIKEQTFDNTRESFNASEFLELSKDPNPFFIEPSFLVRYGWKEVQFQFQYSSLIQTGGRTYNMGKVRWNLGLSFPFKQ